MINGKMKRDNLNLSKTNSVGFITTRSISGTNRVQYCDNNQEQKYKGNSYCNSNKSQTVSNRHSYAESSMR